MLVRNEESGGMRNQCWGGMRNRGCWSWSPLERRGVSVSCWSPLVLAEDGGVGAGAHWCWLKPEVLEPEPTGVG